MTSMTDVHPVPASSISGWDHEADVVIAGYGVAGAAAAVEAARAGADVLVAERTGSWGGRPPWRAGSSISAAAHHCKRLAVSRIPSTTWRPSSTSRWDRVRTRTASPTTAPAASITSIGSLTAACRSRRNSGGTGWEPPGDQGLMFTGGENAFPFNTIAKPAPRGHVPQMTDKRAGEASAGYMLMKPLVDTATSLGVRSVYDVRAVSLVVQSDGRVAGIIARQYGKRLAVRAHRGVVLACGSFAYNDAMVAQYARGSPAPGRVDRAARRSGHQNGAGARRGPGAHGCHRGGIPGRSPADRPRHPRQWSRTALCPRGHVLRPDRAAHALPAGRHRVLDPRRRRTRRGHGRDVGDTAPQTAGDMGLRDRGRARTRDRPAGRVAASHRQRLQRCRRPRRGSVAAQEA
ncbi:FAD binding domain protein [Mycobacterium xenopi 3993]|nr:FAD binding domain protein [Mycobacterium xenopi 3993]